MSGGRIISSGFSVGPTPKLDAPRTYVVLGAPRGGTSMSAGALRLAGVPMGENIRIEWNEDSEFVSHKGYISLFDNPATVEPYLDRLRGLIAARDQKYDVWGWKDPISALYLDRILGELRNPHLVLVMRDPTAIAMREWAALPQTHVTSASPTFYFDHLAKIQGLYARAVQTVRDSNLPALMLSYERCLRYPQDFACRILAFSGMSGGDKVMDGTLMKKISTYVTPDSVTGHLTKSQRAAMQNLAIKKELSFYGSIDDAYRACADLVNSANYTDALTLSASILAAGVEGQRVAPQFVVPPLRFAVIEAGLCFIRAVALANTGDQRRALREVLKFQAAQDFLAQHDVSDPLVANLLEPVAKLRVTLQKALFGESAPQS